MPVKFFLIPGIAEIYQVLWELLCIESFAVSTNTVINTQIEFMSYLLLQGFQ